MSSDWLEQRSLLLCRSLCAVASVAAVCGLIGCAAQTSSTNRPTIRILSSALTSELVRHYAQAFPEIDFVLVERRSGVSEVEEMQAVDLAPTLADVAYRAFAGLHDGGTTFGRVRAISALYVVPLHLVVRAGSGIRDIRDLRGRSVNMPGNDAAALTELVLTAFGVDTRTIRAERNRPDTAAAKLISGDLDAMLYPRTYQDEWVTAMTAVLKTGGRLLPIEGKPIERLLRDRPFLQLARIPAGIYPEMDYSVRTIGVAAVLLCRSDLDEGLVYKLTRHLFEMLPNATASLAALRFMELDHAPATPIPLHDGAARYYHERQLL